MKLNRKFTIMYLVGIAFVVVVELIGVARSGGGDTITEHWRSAKEKMAGAGPVGKIAAFGFTVGTIGFLGWALLHLALPAGTI